MRNPLRVPFRGVNVGVICFLCCLSGRVAAENRYYIEDQSFRPGSTGNVVSVLGDFDQHTYALSIHVEFDATKIMVTEVELGPALLALEPEFADGLVTVSPGSVAFGVLFDLSDPITKRLDSASGLEVLRLTVDVTATTDASVRMNLVNDPGPPSRLNVMADENGDPVLPAPSLDDGTILIESLAPVIQTVVSNRGSPGATFFVAGRNFDQPNLLITVGGREAEFTLLNDQNLSVIAPACRAVGAFGFARLEICTDFGCAAEDNGFDFRDCGPVPPLIEVLVNNSGTAGDQFFISGKGFDGPNLGVLVCGVVATHQRLGPDLRVFAPACASSGWAKVEVCTDLGCDSKAQGFLYDEILVGTLFVRGDINNDERFDLSDPVALLNEQFSGIVGASPCEDARDVNDDGRVDLSDAIFGLQYLFDGGVDIPPPFPAPGIDPTDDDLEEC